MQQELSENYKYNGAWSLILMHEEYLSSFLNTWKTARQLNIILPETDDSDYQSLHPLLRHVLRSARGYLTWICEQLELPDPGIEKTPDSEVIEEEADQYLLHLIQKWRLPLADIPEEKFHRPVYKSRWGVEYCIDAMLEHAVMHPLRHVFQLRNLIEEQK